MRKMFVSVGVILAAAVTWLAANQWKLQRQVRTLEVENKKLTEEWTQQAKASPESIANAERRLESTREALAATEQRLATVTSQLAALDSQTRNLTSLPRRLPGATGGVRTGARHEDAALSEWHSSGNRPPASSHSPSGDLLQRSWGPEQVVGQPNTDRDGDIPTAWASLNPDGGEEWLHVNYDRLVDISEVRIRETYNPGAISKITAFLPNGQEVTIWEGTEPPAQAPVETAFAPMSRVQASSVKVYMDTKRVPGWNEIDAIELIGSDGTRQWASSAKASSTYAER